MVVALVAVMGAAVVLSLDLPNARRLLDEAQRLAEAAEQARTEAVLSRTAIAVEVDATGYRFLRRGPAGWVDEARDSVLRAHEFPAAMTGSVAAGGAAMTFAPDGDARVNEVVLRSEWSTATVTLGEDEDGTLVARTTDGAP